MNVFLVGSPVHFYVVTLSWHTSHYGHMWVVLGKFQCELFLILHQLMCWHKLKHSCLGFALLLHHAYENICLLSVLIRGPANTEENCWIFIKSRTCSIIEGKMLELIAVNLKAGTFKAAKIMYCLGQETVHLLYFILLFFHQESPSRIVSIGPEDSCLDFKQINGIIKKNHLSSKIWVFPIFLKRNSVSYIPYPVHFL